MSPTVVTSPVAAAVKEMPTPEAHPIAPQLNPAEPEFQARASLVEQVSRPSALVAPVVVVVEPVVLASTITLQQTEETGA